MSLLGGGIAGAFGEIFAPEFLDGVLIKSGWRDDEGGTVTREPQEFPVKVQIDRVTYAQRQAEGFNAQSVRVIILQRPNGAQIAATPADSDSVRVQHPGAEPRLWRLDMVEADAAASHWEARGTPTKVA